MGVDERRTMPKVGSHNGKRRLGQLVKDAMPPGSGYSDQTRLAQDALRPRSGAANGERRIGSWRKAQFAQGGVVPWELLTEGKGEERSPANGRVVSYRADGNCAAIASVRSVVASRPERVEPAVRYSLFSSYAAVVMGQPELVIRSNRRVKGQRSRSTAPP